MFLFSKKTFAKRAVFAGLILFLSAGLMFVSCSTSTLGEDPEKDYTENSIPADLIGTWQSTFFEDIEISDSEFSYQFFGEGYRGDIKNHRGNNSGAGYITIQFTGNDWDDTTIGTYYMIHYQNLTPSFVEISTAFPDLGLTTQSEAEATYTVTNGNFASHSECDKQ